MTRMHNGSPDSDVGTLYNELKESIEVVRATDLLIKAALHESKSTTFSGEKIFTDFETLDQAFKLINAKVESSWIELEPKTKNYPAKILQNGLEHITKMYENCTKFIAVFDPTTHITQVQTAQHPNQMSLKKSAGLMDIGLDEVVPEYFYPNPNIGRLSHHAQVELMN